MTIMIPAWIDGTLTPVEKLSVHQRGLKHKAVSVFINKGRQTLIQRRALSKYHTPGLWANACCTHPQWDEAPLTCATRRVEEELGITGLTFTHVHHTEYRADVGNGLTEHEIVDIFTATAPDTLKMTLNPSEVMDAKWVDIDELAADLHAHPDRYTPWLRIYMAEHRSRIFALAAQ